jgi:glycerophosphoryl diester phosphodiesterase
MGNRLGWRGLLAVLWAASAIAVAMVWAASAESAPGREFDLQAHEPNQGTVVSEDWYLRENPAYYHGPRVPELQSQDLKVIPYTINDEQTMQRVIDLGVDGIISDKHELLIDVAKRNGLR